MVFQIVTYKSINIDINNILNFSIFLFSMFVVTYGVYLIFVPNKKYLKLYKNYQENSIKGSTSKITLAYCISSFLFPFVLAFLFGVFSK